MNELIERLENDNGILKKESREFLDVAFQNIKNSFEKSTVFRTAIELRFSVLSDLKHPTPDAKYWQLVREMQVHSSELAKLFYDAELQKIKIARLERDLAETNDDLEAKELDIKIKQAELIYSQMKRVAEGRIAELKNQHLFMEELKPKMLFGIEDPVRHQAFSYALARTNEVCMVNNNAAPADKRNIVGRYITAMNYLHNNGLYEEYSKHITRYQKNKLRKMGLYNDNKI